MQSNKRGSAKSKAKGTPERRLDRLVMDAAVLWKSNSPHPPSRDFDPGCEGFDAAMERCAPALREVLGIEFDEFVCSMINMAASGYIGVDDIGRDWVVSIIGVPVVGSLSDILDFSQGESLKDFMRIFQGTICSDETSLMVHCGLDMADAISITPESVYRVSKRAADGFRGALGDESNADHPKTIGQALQSLENVTENGCYSRGVMGGRVLLAAIAHPIDEDILTSDWVNLDDESEVALMDKWLDEAKFLADGKAITFGEPAILSLAGGNLLLNLFQMEVEIQKSMSGISEDALADSVHLCGDPQNGVLHVMLDFGGVLVGPLHVLSGVTPMNILIHCIEGVSTRENECIWHDDISTMPSLLAN